MLSTSRLYHCARCAVQVFICRKCDRGNRYCVGCAAIARRDSIRMANQRYQLTLRGRTAHAARTRRWRARHKKVTDQTPPAPPSDVLIPPDLDAVVIKPAPEPALAVVYQCHFCGCQISDKLRLGFIRRRGPSQAPQGIALCERDHPNRWADFHAK